MRIALIGGGNMGEAMLSAILEKGFSPPEDIVVSDIDENRRQHIQQTYSVGVTCDSQLALHRANVVVLAIKPQNLTDVMTDLNGKLGFNQLLLSIVAGAGINTLSQGLHHKYVIRAMPNTPTRIGEGITVWTATAGVTDQQKEWVSSFLKVMGREIYVADESLIDMATAVSGSGPAYLFLFVESLVDAAVNIGLSRDVAQELVLGTILGSAHLIQKSGKQPAELRRMVTSPGGTTAEALAEFEQGGFSELVAQAVHAAFEKAKSLGSG